MTEGKEVEKEAKSLSDDIEESELTEEETVKAERELKKYDDIFPIVGSFRRKIRTSIKEIRKEVEILPKEQDSESKEKEEQEDTEEG